MPQNYLPKLNGVDDLVRIADFAEIECLRQADCNVSVDDICDAFLGASERGERIISSAGEDEQMWNKVAESFDEAALRVKHCGQGGAYPFSVRQNGLRLEWNPADAHSGAVYLYLLFATRRKDKIINRVDAGMVFEELCAKIAERYWGGPGGCVKAVTFNECKHGGNFPDGINALCSMLREGNGLRPNQKWGRARQLIDDKLDLIVWRSFSDGRPGKLIGFGQCKTGVSWQNQLSDLQPEKFTDKWFTQSPAVPPVRLFFITDRIAGSDNGDEFYNYCVDAGILFDRCRIMEYANGLPENLSDKIGKWVSVCRERDGLLPK